MQTGESAHVGPLDQDHYLHNTYESTEVQVCNTRLEPHMLRNGRATHQSGFSCASPIHAHHGPIHTARHYTRMSRFAGAQGSRDAKAPICLSRFPKTFTTDVDWVARDGIPYALSGRWRASQEGECFRIELFERRSRTAK